MASLFLVAALLLPPLVGAQAGPPSGPTPKPSPPEKPRVILRISAPNKLTARSGNATAQATLGPAESGSVNLVVRVLPRAPGEPPDTINAIVENTGKGAASGVQVRLTGQDLCPQASGCDANASTRAFRGSCWEKACQPCDVEPETTADGNGATIRCQDSLGPGERLEVSLQPSFAPSGPTGPQDQCQGPRPVVLQARSEQPDADPSDNKATVTLPASPRVRSIHFYPAEGPLEPANAISGVLMGQPFRVAVELKSPSCPELDFRRSDGSNAHWVRAPLLAENPNLAVLQNLRFEEIYWPGLFPWGPSEEVVSAQPDQPVRPRLGDKIVASSDEESATLELRDSPDLLASLSLVASGPNDEPRPDHSVRQGEVFRVRLIVSPESLLAREKYLQVLLRRRKAQSDPPGLETVGLVKLNRIESGRYESPSLRVHDPAGTRIDASFAHAPRKAASEDWLVVRPKGAEIVLLKQSMERPTKWRETYSLSVAIGSPIAIEVKPAKDASVPPPEVLVSVERLGRPVAQARFGTARSGPEETLRTKPFLLARGEELKDLRVGDTLTFGVPDLDAVLELPVRGREAYRLRFESATGEHLKEANPGDHVRLTVESSADPEPGAADDVHVLVQRGGAVVAEKVMRLFTAPRGPSLDRTIALGPPDFGMELKPGDLVEARYDDQGPGYSKATDATVEPNLAIVAPVPRLKSLTFETVGSVSVGHRLGVPLSGSVRAIADFERPPSEAPTIEFRATRTGLTLLAFGRPAAPLDGKPGSFATEPVAFASEPRKEDLAAGDLLEARFGDSKWVSIPILGRAGFVKDLRILPVDGSASPAATPKEARFDVDLRVEADFEEPPLERDVSAQVEVGPPQSLGRSTGTGSTSSVRLSREAESSRYRGVIDADLRKSLAFQAGKAVTVRYGEKIASLTLVTGPLPSGMGRLRIIAEDRVGHEEAVPFSVFEANVARGEVYQNLGEVRSGITPATLDLPTLPDSRSPAVTYAVRFGYGPIGLLRTTELGAGKTVTLKATSAQLGRLVVDLRRADGSSVKPAKVRFVRAEAHDGWETSASIDSQNEVELPASLYTVLLTLPAQLGGRPEAGGTTEIYNDVRVVAGATETLRVAHSGRLKVVILDASGKPVSHEIDVGPYKAQSNEFVEVPPRSYGVEYRDIKSFQKTVAVADSRETIVELFRLGRLRVVDTGLGSAAPGRATVEGDRVSIGQTIDVVPGSYRVEFGEGDDSEARTVEVAEGATVEVDRKMLRGRLKLAIPKKNLMPWRFEIEGMTNAQRHEYTVEWSRDLMQNSELVAVRTRPSSGDTRSSGSVVSREDHLGREVPTDEVEITAGSYRVVAQAQDWENRTLRSTFVVYQCEGTVDINAGKSAATSCGATGEVEVTVRGRDGKPLQGRVSIAKGSQSGTIWTRETASHLLFRVPEGNYTVRAEGAPEAHVTVVAGKPKQVTLQAQANR